LPTSSQIRSGDRSLIATMELERSVVDLNPLSAIVRFIGRSGKRIAVTVAGFTVLLAGLVMMVTPGPGILAIVAGLAILATEYAWAEHMLDRAKKRAGQAAKVATASPVGVVLSVMAVLAGIAAAVLWFVLR
jgi:uncharacterized protein (TIGR02611 family)